jgi:hypothetical protein
MHSWIEQLNAEERSKRLEALKQLYQFYLSGEIQKLPVDDEYVNNHIHTTYSFSPYSPSKALWMAFISGLSTAGIMDHDSVGGAEEFIEAGKILQMAVTVGMECRVDMSATRLAGKRINNPDQNGIAYMAVHGIPHDQLERVAGFIKPYQEHRNRRNREMVENINQITAQYGLTISFERDVKPISMSHDGGSITERHILYALALKMILILGRGEKLVRFLKKDLHMDINTRLETLLLDTENAHYAYDLLGVLKSDMVGKFYIPATDECPSVSDVIALCEEIGAISAYAYLGDVGDSVTGDKKTQKFEDDYLELLFEEIKALGFRAVTYMPSRNSKAQLERVKMLCDRHGLFQISGEDINSPRQKFLCTAMKDESFKNLIDSAWALIGHEQAATENPQKAMFSKTSDEKFLALQDRIQYYKSIGKNRGGIRCETCSGI